MIEGTPPSRIWLFGTLVTLDPGETATWRTAAVAHDGGPGAPARGGELVTGMDDGFTDDFDYPTEELEENGWTIENGTFETKDSFLLGDAGRSPNRVRIYREQEHAAGTFELRGVQNEASVFGVRINFISDATTVEDTTAGYQINFKQTRVGEVIFRRRSGEGDDGSEHIIDEDHQGELHDLRIERDPDTYEFTIFYDGEEVLTVEDDTVTESTYWTMAYGGSLDTQRIDALSNTSMDGGAEVEFTEYRGGCHGA